jgi:DtxR family Mn-dependent transcriptional regulator
MKKPLTYAMEDYLEAIFDLGQEKKVVRVKDIAKRMDVKMPTVTSMLKGLSKRGLVDYQKYEYVELTRTGTKVGQEMRRRHEVLFRFLTTILKVGPKKADEEACKMEHALSPATLDRFTDFMDFIHACPRAGNNWLQHFEEYRRHGRRADKCLEKTKVFSREFTQKVDLLRGEDLCEGCKGVQ